MRQRTDDEILEDLKDWPVRNIYVKRGVRLIEQLRKRVAELEKQIEMNNPLLDEAADAIDKLTAERDAALEQVWLLKKIAKADEPGGVMAADPALLRLDMLNEELKLARQANAFQAEQITTLKSALRVAKEAMQHATESWQTEDYYGGDHEDAIDSCREAIAKIYEVLNVPDGSRTA